jgi:hypothetical protein
MLIEFSEKEICILKKAVNNLTSIDQWDLQRVKNKLDAIYIPDEEIKINEDDLC